jgi:alkylation response protein AidB-like acyl-CoA dehydrogenase
MDFRFSEEQELLRQTVREWTNDRLKPLAAQIDREHRIPDEILTGLRELGMFGVHVPEALGGAGMGEIGLCIFMEEVTRGCFSTAVYCGAHMSIGMNAILLAGSEALQRRLLPRMVNGELIGAYALTEASSGSDAVNMQTTARRDGDDWILDGAKIWITNGDVADVVVVFACTDKSKGAKGTTAFVVEKTMAGFRAGKREEKMGQCGSSTVELHFDGVRVPDANRIGEIGGGFKVAMATLDRGRLTLGANCLGAAKEALAVSARYALERQAFGKPIAEQQAIQHMLADMRTDVFTMESIVYRAAWMCDQSLPFGQESAMVKLFCSEALDRVVDNAVQIHGGMGYSREYAVERMYRDARVNRIYEGTSEIQRLVIARAVLREAQGA